MNIGTMSDTDTDFDIESIHTRLRQIEDNVDETSIHQDCKNKLYLMKKKYLSNNSLEDLIGKCVVHIVRILPEKVLGTYHPEREMMKSVLLRRLENYDQKVNFVQLIIQHKTFIKLHNSMPSAEDKQNVYSKLIEMVFKLVQKDIDMAELVYLLHEMISDTDYVPENGICIIIKNLVQNKHPNAEVFAKFLVGKCERKLFEPIHKVIYDELLQENGLEEKLAAKCYLIIYKLYEVLPKLWLNTFNKLRPILTENRESCKSAMIFLSWLFTENGSGVAVKLSELWNDYMTCITMLEYRKLFLQHCPHFFVTYVGMDSTYTKLIDILELSSKNQDKEIRLLTVKAIAKCAHLIPRLLTRRVKLFNILKDMISHKEDEIKWDAFDTLGRYYKLSVFVLQNEDAKMIINFIMHEFGADFFYNPNRKHINKLIKEHIVPQTLPTKKRMYKLIKMWFYLDDESKLCFLKYLDITRRNNECWKAIQCSDSKDKDPAVKDQINVLTQQIMFLSLGEEELTENIREKCHELQVLLQILKQYDIREFETPAMQISILKSREQLMILICELVHECPWRIGSFDIWKELVSLLNPDEKQETVLVLKMFALLPAALDEQYLTKSPDIFEHFAVKGSPQQTKYALKFLCKHEQKFIITIQHILKNLRDVSEDNEQDHLRGIVTLGYLSQCLSHDKYTNIIIKLCKKIIHKHILQSTPADGNHDLRLWTKKKELPHNLLCKVEALKAMTRVVCSKKIESLTLWALEILGTLVDNNGDYTKENHLSPMDKNWLQLTAGCSYLKMCSDLYLFKYQIPVTYFFKMARLVNDPIRQIRNRFITKLGAKHMQFNDFNCSLVNHFLAYFCLCANEKSAAVKDDRIKLLEQCIREKRMYLWYYSHVYCMPTEKEILEQYHLQLPEISVQITVSLLAHITMKTPLSENNIKNCLSFLMASLLNSKVSSSFPMLSPKYYMDTFTRIKASKDAITPENKVIHRICAIAEKVLNEITSSKSITGAKVDKVILDENFFL